MVRAMKSIAIWLGLLMAVAAPTGAAAAAEPLQRFERSTLTIATAEGERQFEVELATTPAQQAQGLMFRRKLAPDAGMLFVYRPPRRASMWMKNTPIPLDMLFIRADGTVESIRERTVPQSMEVIRSNGPVAGVLELNGGTADRLGIRPGDRVRHPAFER